jgi:hypothetical protein
VGVEALGGFRHRVVFGFGLDGESLLISGSFPVEGRGMDQKRGSDRGLKSSASSFTGSSLRDQVG